MKRRFESLIALVLSALIVVPLPALARGFGGGGGHFGGGGGFGGGRSFGSGRSFGGGFGGEHSEAHGFGGGFGGDEGFGGSRGFGNGEGFAGKSGFGMGAGFGGEHSFSSGQGFAGNHGMGTGSGFGGNSGFGNQSGFAGNHGFGNRPGFDGFGGNSGVHNNGFGNGNFSGNHPNFDHFPNEGGFNGISGNLNHTPHNFTQNQLNDQGNSIRHSFDNTTVNNFNHYGNNWNGYHGYNNGYWHGYANGFYHGSWAYPGSWYCPMWSEGAAWTFMGVSALTSFLGLAMIASGTHHGSNNNNGGGNVTNITYEGDNVYINGQPNCTAAQYYTQAQNLAAQAYTQPNTSPYSSFYDGFPNNGQPASTTTDADEKWEPLGVFALAEPGETQSNMLLQLAINQAGIVRGNYMNQLTDEKSQVYGALDKSTQRISWTIGQNKNTVFDTSLSTLCKNDSQVLVHYGPNNTQEMALIRLSQNGSDSPKNSNSNQNSARLALSDVIS